MRKCKKCNIGVGKGRSYCMDCQRENAIQSQKRGNLKREKHKRAEYVKNNPGLRLFLVQRQRMIVARPDNPTKIATKDIIGCDHHFLKKHIESQFKDGMCWDNYGIKTWHVDHIKPVSLFNLHDDKQLMECFNYRNLQPLWAIENRIKRNKY